MIHVPHDRAQRLRGHRGQLGQAGRRRAPRPRATPIETPRSRSACDRYAAARRSGSWIWAPAADRVAAERQRRRQRDVVGGEVALPTRREPIAVERTGDPDDVAGDVAHARRPRSATRARRAGASPTSGSPWPRRYRFPDERAVGVDADAPSRAAGRCGSRTEAVEKGHRQQQLLVGRGRPRDRGAVPVPDLCRRRRPPPTSGDRRRSDQVPAPIGARGASAGPVTSTPSGEDRRRSGKSRRTMAVHDTGRPARVTVPSVVGRKSVVPEWGFRTSPYFATLDRPACRAVLNDVQRSRTTGRGGEARAREPGHPPPRTDRRRRVPGRRGCRRDARDRGHADDVNVSPNGPSSALKKVRVAKGPQQIRILTLSPGANVPDIAPATQQYPMWALTSTMSANAGAIAGVNGDFGTGGGPAVHTLMIDGELWTTGVSPGARGRVVRATGRAPTSGTRACKIIAQDSTGRNPFLIQGGTRGVHSAGDDPGLHLARRHRHAAARQDASASRPTRH